MAWENNRPASTTYCWTCIEHIFTTICGHVDKDQRRKLIKYTIILIQPHEWVHWSAFILTRRFISHVVSFYNTVAYTILNYMHPSIYMNGPCICKIALAVLLHSPAAGHFNWNISSSRFDGNIWRWSSDINALSETLQLWCNCSVALHLKHCCQVATDARHRTVGFYYVTVFCWVGRLLKL